MLLFLAWGCERDDLPLPEEPAAQLRYTRLEQEPALGQMLADMRQQRGFTKNPDGEGDVFARVDWDNVSLYEDVERDLSLYTATFLEGTAEFTDNMVVGGTADQPFAYVVRYRPKEGRFDGRLSTFTGTVEMYTVEGQRFGHTELLHGKSQLHLRGSSFNESCNTYTFEVVVDCSTGPGDYCTEISAIEIEICVGTGGGSPPLPIGVPGREGGSGGGGSSPGGNRPVLVPLILKPCKTGDEVLDDESIQAAMDKLWKGSNTDKPLAERSENGGWIVKNSQGKLSFEQVDWPSDPCGMNPPSNFMDNMPSNAIGFIHTHPFFKRERTRSVCGEGARKKYRPGFSKPDYDFLLYVIEQSGKFGFKGYVIDGNKITTYDFRGIGYQVQKKRCGY